MSDESLTESIGTPQNSRMPPGGSGSRPPLARIRWMVATDAFLFVAALLIAYLISYGASARRVPWAGRFIINLMLTLPGKLIIVSLPGVLVLRKTWKRRRGCLIDALVAVGCSWMSLVASYVLVLLCYYLPRFMNRQPLFSYSDRIMALDFVLTALLVSLARLVSGILTPHPSDATEPNQHRLG